MPEESPEFDAERFASGRGVLATALGSAEIRRQVAADIRRNSVFVSRCANAVYLTKVKEVAEAMAGGRMSEGEAKATLQELLKALGYTPEGGFPDAAPGEVPEAVRGSLQDLSSNRRLDLIVRTQLELARGAGRQLEGHSPQALKLYPA